MEPPPKRNRLASKRFQQQWYDDNPGWKKWLKNIPNEPNKFKCIFCHAELSGGASEIKKHEKSRKHIGYAELLARHENTDVYYVINQSHMSFMDSEASGADAHNDGPTKASENEDHLYCLTDDLDFSQKVKEAEILIVTMAASLDIPFSTVKHIVKTFQHVGKNADVLQAISLSQTKVASIMNNVITPSEAVRVQKTIKKNKFSVYVETPDNNNEKWMSLMVRYINPITLVVQNEFFELLPLNASDYSSSDLFKAFETALEEKKIPISNVVGVACDDTPLMVNSTSSFKARLLEANRKINVFPCICQTLALLVHGAVQNTIPVDIDNAISSITTYVNSRPGRSSNFKDCPIIHSDVRWLSRFRYFDKLLKEWDNFTVYLKKKNLSNQKSFAAQMNNQLENVVLKAYFHFLNYTINKFNEWIESLQTKDTMIQNVEPMCKEILVWVLGRFIKASVLEDANFDQIRTLDSFLENENYQLPLQEVDLGSECTEYINNQTFPMDTMSFRKNCMKFYISAAEEIKNSLPLDVPFLSNLTVFKAENALLNYDREKTFSKVVSVANALDFRCNFADLRAEWEELINLHVDLRTCYSKLSFDALWIQLGRATCDRGLTFPNLGSLVNIVRTLPHSNAQAQHACSILNDVRNRKRNKLSNETLNSLCLIKWNLRVNNISSTNYKVTKQHLRLMRSDLLYKRRTSDAISQLVEDDLTRS